MEHNLHKLYLYASNSPLRNRKSGNLNTTREQSLKNLMKLLDNKTVALPTASLQQYTNIRDIIKQQHIKKRNQQINLINEQKQENQHPKQASPDTKKNTMAKSYLLLPKVSQAASLARQKQIEQEKQAKLQKKVQEHIEEYMKKIQEQNLLDQCQDHSQLVQQAVRTIRQKIYLQSKVQQGIKNIRPVKVLKQRRSKAKINSINSPHSSINIKNTGIQENIEEINEVIDKVKKKLSNQKSKDSLRKHKDYSLDKIDAHRQLEKERNWKYTTANRTFLQDPARKQQSIAHQNLYRIDLDRLNKNMELRDKERRRSQRNFVHKLSRKSFHNLS